MRDLKAHARATILQEVKVTPEMRARLERRIRREEGRRSGTAWRPWMSAAVAAAAFLVIVGPMLAPAPGPKADAPAPAVPPLTQPPLPAPTGQVIALPGEVEKLTISGVRDEDGQVLSYSAQLVLTDAQGRAVGTVVPPPSGIAGAEARPGQRIVLNADYTLEVKEASQTVAALQSMALAAGGYVVESTLNQSADGAWAGRLLLRVPADRFGEAAGQVVGAGKVIHQRQWAQDVTDQYTDLQSRLKVLQEHEQKLQELALKAATFDDWLRLARQINETRTQIENLQGSLKQLANKVEYATLNIGLVQPAPGKVAVQQGEGLWGQMSAAFAGSVQTLGSLGRSALIGLAGSLPLVGPLALALVWFFLRLRRRRSS